MEDFIGARPDRAKQIASSLEDIAISLANIRTLLCCIQKEGIIMVTVKPDEAKELLDDARQIGRVTLYGEDPDMP